MEENEYRKDHGLILVLTYELDLYPYDRVENIFDHPIDDDSVCYGTL